MPAVLSSHNIAVGADVTSLTVGTTAGGSNRAILVANIGYGSTYSNEVKFTNDSGSLINDVVGGDNLLDLFSFTFAHSKAWGEAGSPSGALTTYHEFPGTVSAVTAAVICLADVDQTTPFGTEQLSTQEFFGSAPQAVFTSRAGLTPGQLVVGVLEVFTLGEGAPTGFTETTGTDIEIVRVGATAANDNGRRLNQVVFQGYADGSGNLDASIDVAWPNAGELIIGNMRTWPVNEASGGPASSTPSIASGAATSSSVAGRSTAVATRSAATGVATSSTVGGRSTAQASRSTAAGVATSSAVTGRAVNVSAMAAAAGSSSATSLVGSAGASAVAASAIGVAVASALVGRSTSTAAATGASGSAITQVLTSASSALAAASVAGGIAATQPLAGRSTVISSVTAAAGSATSSTVVGSSTTAGTSVLTAAAGSATTSTLSGRSTVSSGVVSATGIAVASSVSGGSIARATSSIVPASASTSVVAGRATIVGVISQAVATATSALLSASTVVSSSLSAAAGNATAFVLSVVDVVAPSLTALRVVATWDEWVKVVDSGVIKFRLVSRTKVLTSDLVTTLPASAMQVLS